MPYRKDITWMKFAEFVSILRSATWTTTERETAVSVDRDGRVTRMVKHVIVADGSVCFVADNSVEAGGAAQGSHEAAVAAHLTVQAVEAMPRLAGELATARELLSRAQAQLPDGQLQNEVRAFLDDGGYVAEFDSRGRTM